MTAAARVAVCSLLLASQTPGCRQSSMIGQAPIIPTVSTATADDGIFRIMNAVRGRVHGGRVELEGDLPEGADVVVLATNRDEPFDLAEAEIAELEARMAAADQGDVVPATEVLQKLRTKR
jgi:hypothetical protein